MLWLLCLHRLGRLLFFSRVAGGHRCRCHFVVVFWSWFRQKPADTSEGPGGSVPGLLLIRYTWGEATRRIPEPLRLDWGYVAPGSTDPRAAQEQENEASNFDKRGIAA